MYSGRPLNGDYSLRVLKWSRTSTRRREKSEYEKRWMLIYSSMLACLSGDHASLNIVLLRSVRRLCVGSVILIIAQADQKSGHMHDE